MTKQLIHRSPLGELEIPTVLEPVAAGVPFEVDDDIAASLLEQHELYELAKKPTVPELKAIAAERGIDITGLKKAADISAAIAAADAEEEGE
ncbi:SAP domain-containing protein [Microbacterium jejuense]|uniref:SAP domain-containing protein n=1 Tax=Microbacterium jejuense TaxID=1263637 RepID=A0ABS7HNT9_9MICO|nr:SAP domain-containing protein [Microbacterium jejuense]MBW9094639.1 SAP domain-containing protein [Microbacterium jejuense]